MREALRPGDVTAFGWKVARVQLPEGKSYGLLVVRDSDRTAINSAALFTAGLIESVNLSTGDRNRNRVPGAFSPTFGPIPAGRYKLTALEDAEWWCVDARINGRVPDVGAVSLQPGETALGNLLICSGPHAGTATDSYTAQTPCHVLNFREVQS